MQAKMLSERQQMALLMKDKRPSQNSIPSMSLSAAANTNKRTIPQQQQQQSSHRPVLTKQQLAKPLPIWQPQEYNTWIPQKQAAWSTLRDDPTPFYYWYSPPGHVETIKAIWSDKDITRLHTLIETRLSPGEVMNANVFSYLAMYLPGKTGVQIQEQFKLLFPKIAITPPSSSVNKYSPNARLLPKDMPKESNKTEQDFVQQMVKDVVFSTNDKKHYNIEQNGSNVQHYSSVSKQQQQQQKNTQSLTTTISQTIIDNNNDNNHLDISMNDIVPTPNQNAKEINTQQATISQNAQNLTKKIISALSSSSTKSITSPSDNTNVMSTSSMATTTAAKRMVMGKKLQPKLLPTTTTTKTTVTSPLPTNDVAPLLPIISSNDIVITMNDQDVKSNNNPNIALSLDNNTTTSITTPTIVNTTSTSPTVKRSTRLLPETEPIMVNADKISEKRTTKLIDDEQKQQQQTINKFNEIQSEKEKAVFGTMLRTDNADGIITNKNQVFSIRGDEFVPFYKPKLNKKCNNNNNNTKLQDITTDSFSTNFIPDESHLYNVNDDNIMMDDEIDLELMLIGSNKKLYAPIFNADKAVINSTNVYGDDNDDVSIVDIDMSSNPLKRKTINQEYGLESDNSLLKTTNPTTSININQGDKSNPIVSLMAAGNIDDDDYSMDNTLYTNTTTSMTTLLDDINGNIVKKQRIDITTPTTTTVTTTTLHNNNIAQFGIFVGNGNINKNNNKNLILNNNNQILSLSSHFNTKSKQSLPKCNHHALPLITPYQVNNNNNHTRFNNLYTTSMQSLSNLHNTLSTIGHNHVQSQAMITQRLLLAQHMRK